MKVEPSTSPHPPPRRQMGLVALGTACVLMAPHLGVCSLSLPARRFGIANALVFAVFAAAICSHWPANFGYAIAFHACADMGAFRVE